MAFKSIPTSVYTRDASLAGLGFPRSRERAEFPAGKSEGGKCSEPMISRSARTQRYDARRTLERYFN